ncbi:hypothetical protein LTR22_025543 [Elasticomyces elasticus]|nr:hypothetical protein LTR22_025543 [Elasticomyces elasticus]
MSGAEAIVVVQLIDACIGITKTILDIGRAIHDARGLPPQLRALYEHLPIIEELLEKARETCEEGKVTRDAGKSAEPILKQCEQALGELRDIFRKACPKDGDDRSKRIWKGAKAVFFGRHSQLQKLLRTIQDNLKLLEQKEMYVIGDKLDALQQLTGTLAQEDNGKYTHSGAGNIVANEGGTPTNYVQGGEYNRQINNPGVYHEGPAYTYKTYLPLERPETPPRPTSNIPFRRDPDFVERKELNDQIHTILSAPGARAALAGLGGVGKSQIAIEYCYRVREQSQDTWVLWIHASTAARFEQSVRDAADLVKIDGRNDPKADIYMLFRDWLRDERKGSWVIVLDNADDASFLVERDGHTGRTLFGCLPAVEHGRVLITTLSDTAALRLVDRSEMIGVRPMDEEHALALLRKKLGADRTDLVALACALEYMPLAIAQAAAYIRKAMPRCSALQYLEQLERSDRSKTNLLSANLEDLRRDSEAKNSIMLTWQISFEHVRHNRRSAADLLSLMSFFHHQEIPESLLQFIDMVEPASNGPSPSDGKDSAVLVRLFRRSLRMFSIHPSRVEVCTTGIERGNPEAASHDLVAQAFEEDIIMLREYHFISAAPKGATFEMHRLVQLAAQRWLEASGEYQAWAQQSLRNLDKALPDGSYKNWQKCRTLYPHANLALDLKLNDGDGSLSLASVLFKAAWFMGEQGQYKVAEEMNRRALKGCEKTLGPQHPDTLTSINNLAKVLESQGKYEAAEEMNRRALKGREKALGSEHPSTLASVSNLAGVLEYQGKYEAAEEMNRRALKGREKVLGPEHPDTLTSVSNLAGILESQGKYEAAEEMNRRALKGREKALEPEHPDTLTSVSNLAGVLQYQGKYEAAEEMNRRALKGWEKVLGPEHPFTLTSVGNLALVLQYQCKYEVAEEMNRRALKGREKALGSEHPSTLASIGNLAGVLQYQGKYEAAEETNRRALKGYEKALGLAHPSTLASVSDLAVILQSQGKYEAAEEMNRRALKGREKALGPEHPNTLTSVSNLAAVLQYQGKYDAAEEMNRRALKGREKALGSEHPSTLASVSDLAVILQSQAKYEAAEEMDRRALKGREKALGPEHPDTLASVSNLALVLQYQGKYEAAEEMNRRALKGREKGKYEAAEEMNRRALKGREKALGSEHPSTLASVSNLALVLMSQGKYEAAEEMNRRALKGCEKALGPEHPFTLASVGNLALVLQYQGKYEAAEEIDRRGLKGREKALGPEHPDALTSVWSLAKLYRARHQHEAAMKLFERAHLGFMKCLGPSHPITVDCFKQWTALREQRQ